MSDYGRNVKEYGSGKNIWFDVPKVYPSGGIINTSGMEKGSVIPAGSMCALDTAAGTIEIISAIANAGVAEIDTLTVATGATASGNVTVTLDGTAVNIAVLDTDTTAAAVATKIAAGTFTGWTAEADGAVVTFTASTKEAKDAPVFSGAATGVTGSFAVTAVGAAPDGSDLSTVNGLLYNDVIVNEYTSGTVAYQGMVFEDMLEAPIPATAKAKIPQITYFNHA